MVEKQTKSERISPINLDLNATNFEPPSIFSPTSVANKQKKVLWKNGMDKYAYDYEKDEFDFYYDEVDPDEKDVVEKLP
eukprot:CAMPEP_0170549176 /NCGR_PEP_ID=MMETSP0211-20121228/7378_1 /TAXON_ID=311385 /ORGANISM="Pseudokeronopsis sp., Strain OXSARD2" /LENGTH=78 /DNA_ID=CAMNT_0010855065 /DNA_START=500 /DNA_END=736 /DNA_ORIENTATION=+